MYRTNDPIADFSRHDYEEQKWLASRPICKCCGERITDDAAYNIGGDWTCEDCMNENLVYID